ncbi:MAG: hypothetical protein M3O50_17140, partial [Myxococcota bacterium]|nr:hypothetical protein [Myxococcota bacterium]
DGPAADAAGVDGGPVTTVPPDTIGPQLQQSLIWSPAGDQAVVFRKSFLVTSASATATAHIFADAKYSLWVNGRYILAGPSRFDPHTPQFDSIDVTAALHVGTNTVAVLAYGNISAISGQHIKHAGGMALRIQGDTFTVSTDTSWKYSAKTRFAPPNVLWENLTESVDARLEYDCLGEVFDDSAWGHPAVVSGGLWGPLAPRDIPLLREASVTPHLPFTLPARTGSFDASFDRAYVFAVQLDFEATAGTTVQVFGNTYTARAGRQVYRTMDTFGFGDNGVPAVHFAVNGSLLLHDIQFINRVYPFDAQGKFASSDPRLDRLWQISLHTEQQLSEDGYEDCPWERAEWMGSIPVMYPLSRVAMVGPQSAYSDARLLRKILRDIAESQLPDGRLKAHAPSDRFDIHGFIEDYSCLWVEFLRKYYDNTGDKEFVRSMWPFLTKQMDWFSSKRQADGLVLGREFIIFDNPLKYLQKEGTTLNAYVYAAFQDSAYLAGELGIQGDSTKYTTSAASLAQAFNTLLWDGTAYKASLTDSFTDARRWYANLIAMNRGIVPASRMPGLRQGLLANAAALSDMLYPYTHFFLFQELYAMDTPAADQMVLDRIRLRWANMYSAANVDMTTDESFGPRRFHNFGTAAAYFFANDILGVSVDGPIAAHRLVVEPRLGDLTSASGTVVTEYGLVPVSWSLDPVIGLAFSMVVPAGTSATVLLPANVPTPASSTLTVNGTSQAFTVQGRHVRFDVGAGALVAHLH